MGQFPELWRFQVTAKDADIPVECGRKFQRKKTKDPVDVVEFRGVSKGQPWDN
jgi:hypothetical protein